MGWEEDRGGQDQHPAPQGSPLCPVIFLIWIATILEEMEQEVKGDSGAELELIHTWVTLMADFAPRMQ